MKKMDKQKIAENLKILRGERTQKEVADAIGVTSMAISQYENAERIPNDVIKMKLAAYYGVSVESLFFAT